MLEYNQFEKNFWKKKLMSKDKTIMSKLNPLIVWSEIFSFIKGSPTSYQFENFHLSKKEYLSFVGTHKTSLTNETKSLIWELAQDYESWKTSENYFEMIDIVCYLIQETLKVKIKLIF